jgi:hypothetical protein
MIHTNRHATGIFYFFIIGGAILTESLVIFYFFQVPGTAATLAYCTNPDDHEDDFWSNWWNENWQGKPKYSGENLPQRHFVHHKIPHDNPVSNPGPRWWETSSAIIGLTVLHLRRMKLLIIFTMKYTDT